MWLYRVFSISRAEDSGTFYDAYASMNDALRMAKIIQGRSPSHDVTVEGEHWLGLSWWKYQLHRITGTHEGFGVKFKDKHNLKIQETRTVWPDGVELER